MGFIKKDNILLLAIFSYLFVFYFFSMYVKPSFLFNIHGDIKPFGLGYMNKTIFPIWLFSLMIAVLSYLFILYFSIVNVEF